MRKIVSQYKKDKKRKTNQFIVGGVLIFIMLFSTLGYSFMGKEDGNEKLKKINYNGFEFVEKNDFWFTSKENSNFVFKYNPEQIETIESELKSIDNYYGKPLYILSESLEAESEIYKNIYNLVQRMQYACLAQEENILYNNKTLKWLNNDECEEDFPIKTCEDNFIIIKEHNDTGVIQEENCIFIYGPQENLTKLTDGFLFKILGIEQ